MEFVQSANTGKRPLGIFVRATVISLALLFIASPTFGATIVVPNSLVATEGDYANGFPFRIGSNSMRYQQVFDAADFGALSGPELITQISFRPDLTDGAAFNTTLTNIQINLSTTTAGPDGLSSTFAINVGGDDTIVFSGQLSLSSAHAGPVQGPMVFDIIIDLQTPFIYDPSSGNLLLDVRNFDGGITTFFDAVQVADPVSRVFSALLAGVNNPIGSADTAGLIAQFATTSDVIFFKQF